MISSVDTYVYQSIEKILDEILKDERIVDSALARLDKETRENFKRSFTGKNPNRRIEVGYQFPQIKEKFAARIVVQLGRGTVVEQSLGNVEGTFEYRELGSVREKAIIEDYGNNRIGVNLEHHIGDIEGIEELELSVGDKSEVEGRYFTFSKFNLEDLIGKTITVHYIAKENIGNEEQPQGDKIGYTSKEQVVITPLATNMDTARSLDALLKAVLIIMMESAKEKTEYLLQDHEFGEMQNIVPEPIDRLVFGRPITLSYTVSHNLDFDYFNRITKITTSNMVKGGN